MAERDCGAWRGGGYSGRGGPRPEAPASHQLGEVPVHGVGEEGAEEVGVRLWGPHPRGQHVRVQQLPELQEHDGGGEHEGDADDPPLHAGAGGEGAEELCALGEGGVEQRGRADFSDGAEDEGEDDHLGAEEQGELEQGVHRVKGVEEELGPVVRAHEDEEGRAQTLQHDGQERVGQYHGKHVHEHEGVVPGSEGLGSQACRHPPPHVARHRGGEVVLEEDAAHGTGQEQGHHHKVGGQHQHPKHVGQDVNGRTPADKGVRGVGEGGHRAHDPGAKERQRMTHRTPSTKPKSRPASAPQSGSSGPSSSAPSGMPFMSHAAGSAAPSCGPSAPS